ncbi:MAG TPA: 3'-5' exonuclease, partial [Ktedonobacteraceae bacterium]|nr:3'-5' exonuclease [Ktedonobacteraceae bacterium]
MQHANLAQTQLEDEYLFGWDPMPGIVSVWANRSGEAIIWRRDGERITSHRERFRPWLFATSLDDLAHIGASLHSTSTSGARITYRELDGDEGSYRYLLSSADGRLLEREVLRGASQRLQRNVTSINQLENEYHQVGPVEQYLMASGRVYFRGLSYEDLHRLQFDLETTSLEPQNGRIFLISVRDNHGLATILEAPQPQDEARIIADLCTLIRERDPDVIENHNLFGFDLPFLEHRASVHRIPLRIGRAGGPMLLERREET